MTEKRCKNCKHWGGHAVQGALEGGCGRIPQEDDFEMLDPPLPKEVIEAHQRSPKPPYTGDSWGGHFPAYLVDVNSSGGAGLVTRSDFGCVLWEESDGND